MKKFPSIEQFRQVVRTFKSNCDYRGKDENDNPIYEQPLEYPTVVFKGTVKLHGTNAAIVRYKDGRTEFQSRERVLDLQHDNCGFMLNMSAKNIDFLFSGLEFQDYIAVYGEWCGQGIQKGVAISELPKMFVIFACNVDGTWVYYNRLSSDQGIYNVNVFQTYSVAVDFNRPEYAQNEIVRLTEAVENECPAGKYFGVSGIGEGIVWSATYNDRHYMFKTKGEKHSVSKVKTIASVNVEKIETLNAFSEYAVTENRLEQGISKLQELGKPLDKTSTGDFVRWVVNDVVREEQDTIVENQFYVKKLQQLISEKARKWFFEKYC
jgi:hypothetical protein